MCPPATPPALWGGFVALVAAIMAIDLTLVQRRGQPVRMAAAAAFSVTVLLLAGAFAGVLWHVSGRERALQFVTGYVVEEALSVDNLFVFLLIFARFKVGRAEQQRVLFWGIFGALVMRAGFIAAGTALVAAFHWLFYVFGAFLLYTGGKLLWHGDAETQDDAQQGWLARAFRRAVPTTRTLHGARFVAREDGRLRATPLLLVLLVVEASDIMFAVDSIPAIFSITTDAFVVYTSNIFAILGLRSLFFLLAGMLHRFVYLKAGLGVVLVLIGAKMLVEDWLHVPTVLSLAAIAVTLAASALASVLRRA